MELGGLISRVYMFFGTRNPILWSTLKPEVELMVFLRMRSQKKITKNAVIAIKMELVRVIFRVSIFFGTQNMNMRCILKPEVELMVFQRMRSQKNHEKRRKCHKNGACTRNFPRVYICRHAK